MKSIDGTVSKVGDDLDRVDLTHQFRDHSSLVA
jgi:hypothetical protein